MSFIAKSPLSITELNTSPPLPPIGTRGMFAKEDGWYEIDDEGNTKKISVTVDSLMDGTSTNPVQNKIVVGFVNNKIKQTLDSANEYTDDAVAEKADINHVHETYATKEKVDTVESIAKGANQAVSFDNYESMIEFLNDALHGEYKIGQNIYIGTVKVPDLWIRGIENADVQPYHYNYTTDEEFINDLEENGNSVPIGYYWVSMLETQKVDLTEYAKKSELPTKESLGLDKVDNTPDSEKSVAWAEACSQADHAHQADYALYVHWDINGSDIVETYATKYELNTAVGDIETALDNILTIQYSLIGGADA